MKLLSVFAVFASISLLASNANAFLNLIPGGGAPSKPADTLQVSNPSAFIGKSELALGSFKVTFVTFDKSSSTATASMASPDSGFAKMTLRARLAGVDDAVFQRLTDFAYQDFIEQLETNGFKVVDRSRLESAPSYEKLGVVSSPVKVVSTMTAITGGSRESATFSPSGLPLYHKREFGAAPRAVPFGIHAVADEAGVPVINAHYIVHFAYFQGSATSTSDLKIAKVTLGQTVRIEHGSQAELAVGHGGTFSNPNSNIIMTWGEASDMPYGTTSDATSDAQVAANTFSSVVGVFSGGSMSAREYLIQADPAKYSEAAKDVIGRANKLFVGRMGSLR